MHLVFYLLGSTSIDVIIIFGSQVQEHLFIMSSGSSDCLENTDLLFPLLCVCSRRWNGMLKTALVKHFNRWSYCSRCPKKSRVLYLTKY